MIALLFAGQHTSSVTSSWTGLLLFEANNKKKFLPGVLEEQEVRSSTGGARNARY
jgi:sterol 14-demethylase